MVMEIIGTDVEKIGWIYKPKKNYGGVHQWRQPTTNSTSIRVHSQPIWLGAGQTFALEYKDSSVGPYLK